MRKEKEVSIVLVFLTACIESVPCVLLLRRGENLAYMKNMWSVIAGVVNGDIPLCRQALIEIAGETSLLPKDVSTPSQIGVFSDNDDEAKKTWIRHLFMAHVVQHEDMDLSTAGVRLDYEHSEAAWIPIRYVLSWLNNAHVNDPVARAILCDEAHTPDLKKNLHRIACHLQTVLEEAPMYF